MLVADTRSITFNDSRWWLLVCLSLLVTLYFEWISHIGTCTVHDIAYKESVIYLSVICSFLRNITTMTIGTTAAHNGIKGLGGTMFVICLILTACILMVHILLLPMASNGERSKATTILWNAQRWKLKPDFKSLEPGSSNISAQEQLSFRFTIAHHFFWKQRLVWLIILQGYLVFITVEDCFVYFVHYLPD